MIDKFNILKDMILDYMELTKSFLNNTQTILDNRKYYSPEYIKYLESEEFIGFVNNINWNIIQSNINKRKAFDNLPGLSNKEYRDLIDKRRMLI